MKNFIILSIIVIFITLFISYPDSKKSNKDTNSWVQINNIVVPVEVVKDNASISKGLGGRKSLASGSGMLFDFPQKDILPKFWMKDMYFPIDIIWINNNKITGISKNVPNLSPDTKDSDLPLYSAPGVIDYVLEVNAGFSDENGFSTGDDVKIAI